MSLAKQKSIKQHQPQSMPRHDMFPSPQPSGGNGRFQRTPNQFEDPDYEYYEYDEDPSKNSFDLAEEEYIHFLQEHGHQDFTLISFLPEVRTVDQFVDKRENNFVKTNRVQRADALLGGNFEINKNVDNMGTLGLEMKKKVGKMKDSKQENLDKLKREGAGLSQIDEKPEEASGDKKEAGSEKISFEVPTQAIRAERFDFTFNQRFIKHNVKVDKYGERITAWSHKVGRLISRDCMSFEPNFDLSATQFDYFDRRGNKIPKPMEPSMIPIEELTHVFYYQYRIDKVFDPQNIHPKIIVGLCRDTFNLNQDVSRARDLWCINLATGDINTGRHWADYYQIEQDVEPPFGYFEVGSVVGIMIDMQRGILNFFKDGYDLGQAFVETRLKYGELYPFIETQEPCEMSIFHPFVYPAYRPPLPEGEELEQSDGDYNWHTINDTMQQIQVSDQRSDKNKGADIESVREQRSQGSQGLRRDKAVRDSQRGSQRNDQEEYDQEQDEKGSQWVPNTFTNMFGGDGQEQEEKPNKQTEQKSNQRGGSIFTPVAAVIDSVRRSLSGSNRNRGQDNQEDGQDPAMMGAVNGGGSQGGRHNKENKNESRVSGQRSGDGGGDGRHHRKEPKSRGSRGSMVGGAGGMNDEDHAGSDRKRREDYNKQLEKQKAQVIKDMKESQKNMSMQEANSVNRSIRINDIDINLGDIDMAKLTKEQNKDIKQIERLEKEMDQLTAGNMTLGNVDDIDKNFSMRPTVLSGSSQRRQIGNLQYEIEKYQKEIELLKLKLQFKHQIMSYKTMERNRGYQNQYEYPGGGHVNYQTDPCSIF